MCGVESKTIQNIYVRSNELRLNETMSSATILRAIGDLSYRPSFKRGIRAQTKIFSAQMKLPPNFMAASALFRGACFLFAVADTAFLAV